MRIPGSSELISYLRHQYLIDSSRGLCKHHTMLEVANLIAVVGGDTTRHTPIGVSGVVCDVLEVQKFEAGQCKVFEH
jgi:hypothetical protein